MHCYKYPRPAVATDALVFGFNNYTDQLELLLIERKNEPFQGMLALPGGFLQETETIEECASRELAEETELLGVPMVQMKVFSDPDRDPRTRVISVAFFSFVNSTRARVEGADDASAASWYNLLDLPTSLAFDHKQIIDYGVNFFYNNLLLKTYLMDNHDFQVFRGVLEIMDTEKIMNFLSQYIEKQVNIL